MRLRRPKTLVIGFATAVLLAAGALQTADLWWRRQNAIDAAEVRAQRIAKVVAEYVRGTFELADTSLRQLVIHGQRVGGPDAPEQDWLPILNAAEASLHGAGSVSVTDAHGVIRHSTLAAIVGQSRRNSYAFQRLSTEDPGEMVVDAPFRSPLHFRFVLPVARRMNTADGRFTGIVAAVVAPEQSFREFVKTLTLGEQGALWIFHPAGTVVFREPSASDPMGEQAGDHPMFLAARHAREGILKGAITAGGRPYISAFRTMQTTPLAVVVSLSEEEALEGWRRQRRSALIEFVAFVVTVGVLVVMIFRQMDARSMVEDELAAAQALEAQRLREANDRLAAALEREMQARRESDDASRLKDEFLMTLSHELRTPLNAIAGWARMLSTESLPRERQQHALDTIERNAAAQTRLVEDLLDVSRAISGKLQIEARRIDVADAVLRAVETLRPAMVAKGITFEQAVTEGLPPILADPDRLQQIVWNLPSNAIKFTPEGGRVDLRVARLGANVEISVTDTGIGIDPAFLPYAFDRFRQADAGPRREHGGLGLGLAIVRQLTELHGGHVSARSDGEGKGATFRVVLPVQGTK